MFLNLQQNLWGRWLASLFVLLCLFQLSGCGDKEPKQRSAFIIFLQTEIVSKNRINLPALTPDQIDSFGEYAKHYQLLVDFNEQLKTAFSPLTNALQTLRAMSSMKEMVANRDKIEQALQQVKAGHTALLELLHRLEQQKAELIQPEDLKTVFEKAYDKVVVQQIAPAKNGIPFLEKLLTNALALIDFVNAKGDDVKITLSTVEFAKQEDVEQFNRLNTELQQAQSDYLAFAQNMR